MADTNVYPGRSGPYPPPTNAQKLTAKQLADAQTTNQELYRTKASRLTDLFPDELIINQKTITVIRNDFLVSHVETIPVRDIGRVVYVDIPLFGGLQILGKNTAHDLHIKGLYKDQACKAKEIIESLLMKDQQEESDVRDWLRPDVATPQKTPQKQSAPREPSLDPHQGQHPQYDDYR